MAGEETDKKDEQGGRSILPLIIVGVVAIVVGLVAGYFLSNQSADGEQAEVATQEEGVSSVQASGAPNIADSIITQLGSFTVNLKDPTGARKLQMDISVESKNETAASIGSKNAELQNTILLLSSEYTVAMLDGMDGKMSLKDEIEIRINKILDPNRVERVYFTKFIVN
jgi:flagellar basal body-associated protein FliL